MRIVEPGLEKVLSLLISNSLNLQQQVNDLAGNLQALQQRYKLSDPAAQVAELAKQAREVEAQKLDAQKELQEQRQLHISLQKQLGLTPSEAIATSTLSQEPRYQDLLGQLKRTESQLAVDSSRFSEVNPSIQRLRQQQRNISLLLNQEARKILGEHLLGKLGNSQLLTFQDPTRLELIKQLLNNTNTLQVLEARNQAITKAEAYLDRQVRQYPASIRQYNDIQRRLDISTKTLNQLLIQRETLSVDAAQKQDPWEIVSEPTIPHDAKGNFIPARGDNPKKLALGLIATFVLGLGAAALKEKYSNVFYATEDIEDTLQLPLLGEIPLNQSTEQSSSSLEGTETNNSNTSIFLKAFNYLYASLHFLNRSSRVRSLVVSSATPEDGKTTVALHLAQSAALMGQRVLLVDANLRQPQLHNRLGLPNLQGLSNLLGQNLNPNDLIQQSPTEENLFVLTSGQLLSHSTKMLASTRMEYLMEQLQAGFDLVIYDTPHLLDFTDVDFLAEHADGILIVVGIGKTKQSVLTQVLNRLNTFHLPVLGIVANHVKPSTNGLYKLSHSERPTFEKTPQSTHSRFVFNHEKSPSINVGGKEVVESIAPTKLSEQDV